MQVSVRESDNIPGGNRLPPLVIEQEYATTFERNPNLFGGWMAVRWIDGSRLHRNSGERYPPRRGVLRE